MGRDKSALPVDGIPLWQRQLAILRETEPAELFISGKSDGPYAGCGVEILADELPGCGPLGGIATALRRCSSDFLLVLAVDMPAMSTTFLRTLLDETKRTGMGVIPSVPAGLEPLAAIYPCAALALANECLRAGERKLETFIRRMETFGLVSIRPLAAGEAALFINWNSPADVPAPQSDGP